MYMFISFFVFFNLKFFICEFYYMYVVGIKRYYMKREF